MRRLLPDPASQLDAAALAALYRHPLPADGSPWVRANVVASADGAAVGPDGGSASLSNPADRALLVTLRRAADVVLVGSATAAGEGYRPVATPIAVVSTALAVDLDDPLYAAPSTVLLTTSAAPADRRAAARCRIVVVRPGPRGGVDPAAAVAALVDLGLPRVLCEGGPRLLGSVVAAGLLDELCQTVAPKLSAGSAPRVATGPDTPPGGAGGLRLASVCDGDGAVFLRWVSRGHDTP